ncbi:MAG TPA: diacylglycerol kinase family protein [Bacteroidota bacterium]|nr:diacylglycerol kinase family protein [Bacteroidota bacterium]
MLSGRILVIINAHAGGGRGKSRWERLREALFVNGRRIDEHFTTQPGEATRIARDAARGGYTTIVAAGGDGTLNEVLNGVIHGDQLVSPNVTLGHIGLGSSNDFLRSVGRSRPGELLSTATTVDVVKLQCHHIYGTAIVRYFLLNSSIGMISRAIEIFNRPSFLRRLLRQIHPDTAAAIAGLNSVSRPVQFLCAISLDGSPMFEGIVNSVAIVKSPHLGGGMDYGTEYRPEDGRFSVVVFRKTSRLEMIWLMKKFYDGSVVDHRAVNRNSGSEAHITADGAPMIEADGELIGYLPARYTILPKFVTILT